MREKEYKEYVEYLNIIQHKGMDTDLFNSFVNDTILKGITNFDISRGVNIKSYMYTILDNKIKKYSIRKKPIYFEEIEEYNFVDDIDDFDFEEDEKNRKRLRYEIYNLPNKYLLIGIFFFVEKISQKEISDALDMNINTLKTRINLIKKIITKNIKFDIDFVKK